MVSQGSLTTLIVGSGPFWRLLLTFFYNSVDIFGQAIVDFDQAVNFVLKFEDCLGVFVGLLCLLVGGAAEHLLAHSEYGEREELHEVAEEKQKSVWVGVVFEESDTERREEYPDKHPHGERVEHPHTTEGVGQKHRQLAVKADMFFVGQYHAGLRTLFDTRVGDVRFLCHIS